MEKHRSAFKILKGNSAGKSPVEIVVVLSILILHYNMLFKLIHFTMQELVQIT